MGMMEGEVIMMIGTIITMTASTIAEGTTKLVEEKMDKTIITMVASMMAEETMVIIMTASIMAEETTLTVEEKMITFALMMADKTIITMVGDPSANTLAMDKEIYRQDLCGTIYAMHLVCN